MVDYNKPIKNAFSFGIQPKRWLPFFITDLVLFSILIFTALSNADLIISVLNLGANPAAFAGLGTLALGMFLLFIVWFLVQLWIQGAVIHQSYKEKEFDKSWGVSFGKYPSLLGAVILVSLISVVIMFALEIIPIVGDILGAIASVIISLSFFFVLQGVIVSNNGIIKTLRNSWGLFRKKPLDVFIIWLLVTIFAFIILGIFSLPAMFITFNLFLSMLASGNGAASISALVLLLQANTILIIAVGVIFLIGVAISQAVMLKMQTEFYMQVRKKKLGLV